MAWITITAAKVQNRLTEPELVAMTTAAIAVSQSRDQILADAVSGAVREVRSHCPPSIARGEGETVPEECENYALAIIRHRLSSRLPALAKLFYDDLRKQEYADAMAWLRAWAREERFIVAPTQPAAEQAAATLPRITPRPRQFGACDQAGI